jgi:hypothetical protein
MLFLLEVLRVLASADRPQEEERELLMSLIRKTNDELARRKFGVG